MVTKTGNRAGGEKRSLLFPLEQPSRQIETHHFSERWKIT
jgi:hypothetical protein